ncbi:hypothetical protein B0T12DRAFT_400779 [Alternaria alternata]|nr:hypothetical protein B0T12DRAFT_400779 [Alternaria alternata]
MAPVTAASTAPGHRFAPPTADNHSAPIWIASILSLIFAFCILAVRLGFVKWNAHGLDDFVLILAHFVGLGMWVALFLSLNNGLGKSLELLSTTEISYMQKSYYASWIMLVIGLATSKCSALMSIQNIFSQNSKVIFGGKVTICVVVLWGIGSCLAVSLSCSSDHIILAPNNDHCVHLIILLKIVVIGDNLTEIAIIVLPVIGLRNLQMPLGRKLQVFIAFACRILNIPISIAHLTTYSNFHDYNRQAIDIGPAAVWQNILLAYSYMSATLPALKGFYKEFATGGVGYTIDMSTSDGFSRNSNNHELQSFPNFSSNSRGYQGSITSSSSRRTLVQQKISSTSARL